MSTLVTQLVDVGITSSFEAFVISQVATRLVHEAPSTLTPQLHWESVCRFQEYFQLTGPRRIRGNTMDGGGIKLKKESGGWYIPLTLGGRQRPYPRPPLARGSRLDDYTPPLSGLSFCSDPPQFACLLRYPISAAQPYTAIFNNTDFGLPEPSRPAVIALFVLARIPPGPSGARNKLYV
ncbi:hypothetical protein R3P38DRAFT_2784133 [Favolaschia claudopus]|uniref:Uncharacterized protein n=1 Tax=Favolaschia claudopus TaxID=2862362 RepID=A0AAW0AYA5_9AGAR